ncbi:hypothetical protein [Roseateles sp.]|uniref:hypothetical protein n=1 Tax=Roseateles sp. TaxID=1971397 RepID=UPI003D0990A9
MALPPQKLCEARSHRWNLQGAALLQAEHKIVLGRGVGLVFAQEAALKFKQRNAHFDAGLRDREIARAVAEHKSYFFSEKDGAGNTVDYFAAVAGSLHVVPQGAAREALAADYARMLEDQVMVGDALPFEDLMQACAEVAAQANAAGSP